MMVRQGRPFGILAAFSRTLTSEYSEEIHRWLRRESVRPLRKNNCSSIVPQKQCIPMEALIHAPLSLAGGLL
jgi:hypothetical protein